MLFDLDNTLIETHIDFPAMKAEVRQLAEQYGAELPANVDVLGFVRAGASAISAERGHDACLAFEKAAIRRIEEIERTQCAAPIPLPGAAELVRLLRRMGVGVGVVTRNCREVADSLLLAGDLTPDVILARDDVPLVKPNPDHLLRALAAISQKAGRHVDAANSRMVGDHHMDVQAGRAAGMLTVGLLRGREAAFFAPAIPNLLVEDVEELLEMVRTAAPTHA